MENEFVATEATKNQEVVRKAGFYSLASLLTQLVTIVAAFLSRRFLGPAQMGVWSMAQIVLAYANYSNLGVLDAMYRDIPSCKGKGEHARADSLKNTTFTFSVLASFLAAVGVLGYAIWKQKDLTPEIFYGLIFASGLIILQRVNAALLMVLYAYKRFLTAGRLTLYSAAVNASLIALFSYKFKLFGFMIAMMLSFVFNILFIFWRERCRFTFSLNPVDLRALLSYGFPMMLLGLIGTFFDTIDKMMITKYIGLEALGFYSIAAMTYTYIFSIPNSISIVIVPNLHEKFGRNDDKKELKGYLEKSNFFYSNLIPVLVGLGWFVVPYLVEILLPKFTGGVQALRFLVLGSYFFAVGQGYYLYIFVIRKHLILFPLMAVVCLSALGLDWFVIHRGWGIAGVAAATTAALFLQFTLYFIYSAGHVYEMREAFEKYALIILKFLLMIFCIIFIEKIKVQSRFLTAVLQAGLYVLVYSPFLIQIDRRFGVLSIIMTKLKDGGKK